MESQRIRNFYTPQQPTLRNSNREVEYNEFSPHLEIQSYIYCYWELKTLKKLSAPFTYRVVTDGCIDIFFELNIPSESYVMGFCKKYTEFPLKNKFHYFGIRFLPTMFPQIFKVNAALLSNKYQPLELFSESTASYIADNINTSLQSNRILYLLNDYLLGIINEKDFDNDSRLYDAIHIILSNYGVVNLRNRIDTGISHRQLRRLFNYYIGATPKSFSKVVQFQNILKAKPSSQSLKKNKLFYNLGYYDQAHFIKDFKNFYGVTPSKAFGRE